MTNLSDLCENFKSTGIPSLIKNCPEIGEVLENLQGLYDSDGETSDYAERLTDAIAYVCVGRFRQSSSPSTERMRSTK